MDGAFTHPACRGCIFSKMNLADKLAPLVALQARPPEHVHEVRFDEGADGEVWAYVLAHPRGREKQLAICVVARDDEAIAAELAEHEAELAAWTEAALADSRGFVQRGLDLLLEQREAAAKSLLEEAERTTSAANRVMQLGAKIDDLRAKVDPLRSVEKPEVRAQVVLLDLELGRLVEQREARRQATELHRARVAELDSQLDSAKLAVARAEGEFEADVLARLGKSTMPASITDRIAELKGALGRVSIHASGSPSESVVPGAIVEFVQAHADWMRGGAAIAS